MDDMQIFFTFLPTLFLLFLSSLLHYQADYLMFGKWPLLLGSRVPEKRFTKFDALMRFPSMGSSGDSYNSLVAYLLGKHTQNSGKEKMHGPPSPPGTPGLAGNPGSDGKTGSKGNHGSAKEVWEERW
ncbi:uncharacterized protein [Montipora capricornis]|uniref:uncharacterized protein n=1 Tax=Montipora capricornis TaxID=246305 RepID=UPI0035F19E66